MYSAGHSRLIDRSDLFRIRLVGEPAIDPEGKRVAFVVSGHDEVGDRMMYEVYWADLEAGAGATRRCEPPDAQQRHPRWAPGGRRLVVISDRSGVRIPWILDVETGASHVTAAIPGAVDTLDWSPDGGYLVVAVESPVDELTDDPYAVHTLSLLRVGSGVHPVRARRELWVVQADGEQAVPISRAGRANDWAPAWAPDGQTIAFLSDHGVDPDLTAVSGLWLMRSDGSARRQIVDPAGPITAMCWSPNSTEIAYLGHRRGDDQGENVELWTVSADGRQAPRNLSAALDRSIGQRVRGDDERGLGPPDLAWTPDGRRVMAIVADGGLSRLAWFDREGRSGTVLGGDRCLLQFAAARNTGDVAFVASDPASPGELSVARIDGTGERQVTSFNEEWLAGVELSPTRPIRCTVSDGVEVEGWVIGRHSNAGTAPPPLVLRVHGGPHFPVGWRFSLENQALAGQGYLVLSANPRGSQGYGAEFATSIRGDWGGRDFEDLMELVDSIVQAEIADPERLAIVGESYGGYMVNWAIAHTDRFRAAIAENGTSNLISAAGDTSGATFWRSELGGFPWEIPMRYVEQSPLTYVAQIRTPLLLLHSELDGVSPIGQSEEMYAALRALGRKVKFVRIPGEGHLVNLFGRPNRRRARMTVFDNFLAEHLQPRGVPV